MNDETKRQLKYLAERYWPEPSPNTKFERDPYCYGEDLDDYNLGFERGQRHIAQWILTQMNIPFKQRLKK